METKIEALIADMKEASEKATPGDWWRSSTQFNGITSTPFTLGGIEKVIAHTVEKRDAEFISQASPENVLALIAALEQAQQENIALKQKCEIDPRTHEIIDLQERIAELEKCEAAAKEYAELMYYMDSAGDYFEFQAMKIRAASGTVGGE